LHARLVELGGSGVRVRRLGKDRAGEIRLTRFLHNPAVTVTEMVATAAARTSTRVTGRHVLAIQDTTMVRSAAEGIGVALHPLIAVDAVDSSSVKAVSATSAGSGTWRKRKADAGSKLHNALLNLRRCKLLA
jgi:hypothetical protein